MIKLYPDRSLPAFLRVVGDVLTLAWTLAWAGLGWLIEPIIRNLPQESLINTLSAARKALAK